MSADPPRPDPDDEPLLDDDHALDVADDEPPPPSVRRIAFEVRMRSTTLRCTLAAVGAWAITLAPLVVSGRASLATRAVALLAALPAITGPQLLARDNALARHVGISGYLGAALLAWALASADHILATVDIFRAILGVVAWGVFGLAWSHPWSVPELELARAPEGETAGLKPRRKAPTYAAGVAVTGAACALLCLAIAWTVDDPNRAVFAQALGIAAAIALLTSASEIAVIAGKEQRQRSYALPINRSVLNTLILMVLTAAASVALWWSR